jgi:uncharacterized membrane protein HdeD (DUF308 family)
VEQGQEKDNFWVYIGGVIALVIGLVIMFKSTHKEAIPATAYAETAKEVDRQIEAAKKR